MSKEPPQNADENRRHFLVQCAGAIQVAAIGGILSPLLSSCGRPNITAIRRNETTVVASVALLVADGMSATLDIKGPDGKGILLVRESEESYIALSMKCTHKGCEVIPPEGTVIICPCHDSRFDLTGAVVKPPATQPLKRYATTYQSDERVAVITLV